MRRVLGILAVLFLSFAGIATAQAGVSVKVDIAAQRMQVTTTDGEVYNWAISSGRKGFRSPNGVYRPTRLEKNWYSRKYGGAMPYAVFFRGGYAIHGTNAVGALGRPASHGCIRLHTANAAKLLRAGEEAWRRPDPHCAERRAPDGLSQFAKASGGFAKLQARQGEGQAARRHRPEPQGPELECGPRADLPAAPGAAGWMPLAISPTIPTSAGAERPARAAGSQRLRRDPEPAFERLAGLEPRQRRDGARRRFARRADRVALRLDAEEIRSGGRPDHREAKALAGGQRDRETCRGRLDPRGAHSSRGSSRRSRCPLRKPACPA
jgi:hypothetical protein